MIEYRLRVTRIEPHPKAGQEIGPRYSGMAAEVYPATMETTECLNVVLSAEEWQRVKAGCVEVSR